MPETCVIVGASLAVHFFSPRPAVDHVVACLTCRNAAEQSFVCQHGGAPWPTAHEVPGGSSPELVPRGLHPQRIVIAPNFEVIRAAGTLDGEAFGPCVGVSRQSLEGKFCELLLYGVLRSCRGALALRSGAQRFRL